MGIVRSKVADTRADASEEGKEQMAQAILNGKVLAQSDKVLEHEGYFYFPRASVRSWHLTESRHRTYRKDTGVARYFDVTVNGQRFPNQAWTYPSPCSKNQHLEGFVGFDGDVIIKLYD